VAKAYDECVSSIQVAEQFECGESWVRRLIRDKLDMTRGELAEALGNGYI
jgi:hypothetical protein